jgi:hypothetical protein
MHNLATPSIPKVSFSKKYRVLLTWTVIALLLVIGCQGKHHPQRTSTKTLHNPELKVDWATSHSTSAAPTGITSYTFSSTPERSITPAIPSTDYSRYYDPTYRPAVGHHYVNGYYRRNGTYVKGHYRTNPDNSFYNNWSTKGNVNPYTGKVGTRRPPTLGYSRRR